MSLPGGSDSKESDCSLGCFQNSDSLNKAAINAHAQVFVCMQVFNSFR